MEAGLTRKSLNEVLRTTGMVNEEDGGVGLEARFVFLCRSWS